METVVVSSIFHKGDVETHFTRRNFRNQEKFTRLRRFIAAYRKNFYGLSIPIHPRDEIMTQSRVIRNEALFRKFETNGTVNTDYDLLHFSNEELSYLESALESSTTIMECEPISINSNTKIPYKNILYPLAYTKIVNSSDSVKSVHARANIWMPTTRDYDSTFCASIHVKSPTQDVVVSEISDEGTITIPAPDAPRERYANELGLGNSLNLYVMAERFAVFSRRVEELATNDGSFHVDYEPIVEYTNPDGWGFSVFSFLHKKGFITREFLTSVNESNIALSNGETRKYSECFGDSALPQQKVDFNNVSKNPDHIVYHLKSNDESIGIDNDSRILRNDKNTVYIRAAYGKVAYRLCMYAISFVENITHMFDYHFDTQDLLMDAYFRTKYINNRSTENGRMEVLFQFLFSPDSRDYTNPNSPVIFHAVVSRLRELFPVGVRNEMTIAQFDDLICSFLAYATDIAVDNELIRHAMKNEEFRKFARQAADGVLGFISHPETKPEKQFDMLLGAVKSLAYVPLDNKSKVQSIFDRTFLPSTKPSEASLRVRTVRNLIKLALTESATIKADFLSKLLPAPNIVMEDDMPFVIKVYADMINLIFAKTLFVNVEQKQEERKRKIDEDKKIEKRLTTLDLLEKDDDAMDDDDDDNPELEIEGGMSAFGFGVAGGSKKQKQTTRDDNDADDISIMGNADNNALYPENMPEAPKEITLTDVGIKLDSDFKKFEEMLLRNELPSPDSSNLNVLAMFVARLNVHNVTISPDEARDLMSLLPSNCGEYDDFDLYPNKKQVYDDMNIGIQKLLSGNSTDTDVEWYAGTLFDILFSGGKMNIGWIMSHPIHRHLIPSISTGKFSGPSTLKLFMFTARLGFQHMFDFGANVKKRPEEVLVDFLDTYDIGEQTEVEDQFKEMATEIKIDTEWDSHTYEKLCRLMFPEIINIINGHEIGQKIDKTTGHVRYMNQRFLIEGRLGIEAGDVIDLRGLKCADKSYAPTYTDLVSVLIMSGDNSQKKINPQNLTSLFFATCDVRKRLMQSKTIDYRNDDAEEGIVLKMRMADKIDRIVTPWKCFAGAHIGFHGSAKHREQVILYALKIYGSNKFIQQRCLVDPVQTTTLLYTKFGAVDANAIANKIIAHSSNMLKKEHFRWDSLMLLNPPIGPMYWPVKQLWRLYDANFSDLDDPKFNTPYARAVATVAKTELDAKKLEKARKNMEFVDYFFAKADPEFDILINTPLSIQACNELYNVLSTKIVNDTVDVRLQSATLLKGRIGIFNWSLKTNSNIKRILAFCMVNTETESNPALYSAHAKNTPALVLMAIMQHLPQFYDEETNQFYSAHDAVFRAYERMSLLLNEDAGKEIQSYTLPGDSCRASLAEYDMFCPKESSENNNKGLYAHVTASKSFSAIETLVNGCLNMVSGEEQFSDYFSTVRGMFDKIQTDPTFFIQLAAVSHAVYGRLVEDDMADLVYLLQQEWKDQKKKLDLISVRKQGNAATYFDPFSLLSKDNFAIIKKYIVLGNTAELIGPLARYGNFALSDIDMPRIKAAVTLFMKNDACGDISIRDSFPVVEFLHYFFACYEALMTSSTNKHNSVVSITVNTMNQLTDGLSDVGDERMVVLSNVIYHGVFDAWKVWTLSPQLMDPLRGNARYLNNKGLGVIGSSPAASATLYDTQRMYYNYTRWMNVIEGINNPDARTPAQLINRKGFQDVFEIPVASYCFMDAEIMEYIRKLGFVRASIVFASKNHILHAASRVIVTNFIGEEFSKVEDYEDTKKVHVYVLADICPDMRTGGKQFKFITNVNEIEEVISFKNFEPLLKIGRADDKPLKFAKNKPDDNMIIGKLFNFLGLGGKFKKVETMEGQMKADDVTYIDSVETVDSNKPKLCITINKNPLQISAYTNAYKATKADITYDIYIYTVREDGLYNISLWELK